MPGDFEAVRESVATAGAAGLRPSWKKYDALGLLHARDASVPPGRCAKQLVQTDVEIEKAALRLSPEQWNQTYRSFGGFVECLDRLAKDLGRVR